MTKGKKFIELNDLPFEQKTAAPSVTTWIPLM